MAYPLRENFYHPQTGIIWKSKRRVNRFLWNAAASNAVMACLLMGLCRLVRRRTYVSVI